MDTRELIKIASPLSTRPSPSFPFSPSPPRQNWDEVAWSASRAFSPRSALLSETALRNLIDGFSGDVGWIVTGRVSESFFTATALDPLIPPQRREMYSGSIYFPVIADGGKMAAAPSGDVEVEGGFRYLTTLVRSHQGDLRPRRCYSRFERDVSVRMSNGKTP